MGDARYWERKSRLAWQQIQQLEKRLIECHDARRSLRELLVRVEWVDAGGDLYCHFCGASCFGTGHREGCEWVETIGGYDG